MTYQQSLYTMSMNQLVAEAEKYGIKINKKGSKTKAADKIWEMYQQTEVKTEEVAVEAEAVETEEEVDSTSEAVEEVAREEVEPETEEEEVEKKSSEPFKFADSSNVENAIAKLSQYGYTVNKKNIDGMGIVVKMGRKGIIEFYLLKSGKYTALMTESISQGCKNAELLDAIEEVYHEAWKMKYEYFFTEDQLLSFVEAM